jgi:hypothetical protein
MRSVCALLLSLQRWLVSRSQAARGFSYAGAPSLAFGLVLWTGCQASEPGGATSATTEVTRAALTTTGTFGVMTTDKYQNNWVSDHCEDPSYWFEQCYAWDMADHFSDRIDDYASWGLRRGLDNGGYYLHDYLNGYGDIFGADNVDVLWLHTHGGVNDDVGNGDIWAYWNMWESRTYAGSQLMRLGDVTTVTVPFVGQVTTRGLKLFISYSCNILKYSDGLWWQRLDPIFRGGLKYMVGAYDLIHWGPTMDEAGEELADHMSHGDTIWTSWVEATNDWYWDSNHPAAVTTGTDWGDCFDRLQNMTYDQLFTRPPLRDGVGWAYCMLDIE